MPAGCRSATTWCASSPLRAPRPAQITGGHRLCTGRHRRTTRVSVFDGRRGDPPAGPWLLSQICMRQWSWHVPAAETCRDRPTGRDLRASVSAALCLLLLPYPTLDR